jgi:hypothetical protein
MPPWKNFECRLPTGECKPQLTLKGNLEARNQKEEQNNPSFVILSGFLVSKFNLTRTRKMPDRVSRPAF